MLTFEERAATTRFLRGLKRADGGYASQATDPKSGLHDTVSALKALRLLDADPDDPERTRAFVHSCSDMATGGFSESPAETPNVFSTAIGLIALRELGETEGFESRAQRAMRFMSENAASAADHFMIIAAHEEGKLPDPVAPSSASFFRARRRQDGAFGESARYNAMASAALHRAREPVQHPEPVIRRLLGAQGPDGGFADRQGQSDVMTTYAVARALTLLKAMPDIDGLSGYIAALRREEGGYTDTPNAPATAGATYEALSILRWTEELALQSAVEAARRGDVAALREWLTKGGDPDQCDLEGWSPLLAGASRGKAEVVRLLLFHDISGAKRADPDIRFASADALPIYMAGQAGDLETVRLLLRARPQHLFEISAVNGHTVLLQAAFYGKKKHQELAAYLLENVAEILSLPESDEDAIREARDRLTVATNVRGYNALRMNTDLWKNEPMAELLKKFDHTTERQQKCYLEGLLIKIATPQALTDRLIDVIQGGFDKMKVIPPSDESRISQAKSDTMATIKKLVETPGFQINRLGGPLQQPPIVVAATGVDAHQHVSALREEVAAFLLDRGADPDLPEKHPMAVDAVIRAAVLGHLYLLKLIAKYMTPVSFAAAMNARPAVNGLTALHDSVHRALDAPPSALPQRLEQIRWMVKHGARYDIEDHTGETQEGLAREALKDANRQENASAVLAALGF